MACAVVVLVLNALGNLHMCVEPILLLLVLPAVSVHGRLSNELVTADVKLTLSHGTGLADAHLVEQGAHLHLLKVLDKDVILLHRVDRHSHCDRDRKRHTLGDSNDQQTQRKDHIAHGGQHRFIREK